MSEQPSPTSPTDTSEKAEFGGINLLIGFVIGAALQFGWWALLDRLQLRNIDPGSDSFLMQLLAVIGKSHTAGFIIGAMVGATNNSASAPIRSVIWKSTCWALGFGVAFVGVDVLRYALQAALGESLGDIVTSAIWFGLAGALAGVVMELQRTVAPRVGSSVLSVRQIVQLTLKFDGASVRRVLMMTLFGALIGVTIELLFQHSSAQPLLIALLIVLLAVIAVVAIRLWPPSRKTVRQWLSGALIAIIIFDLLALLALNAMLGTLAGIVVLVGYAIIQSRK
jgi:hypothetical protein